MAIGRCFSFGTTKAYLPPFIMNVSEFLDKCLLLDLEGRGDKIYRIGAVYSNEAFERTGRFDYRKSLRELDSFAADARYVLGHNLLDHDMPMLHRALPDLGILRKPVIDTLFLSPLAFPENPYHRLVKNYKLVRETLNDPVADARLSGSVFKDQWENFEASIKKGSGELLSFYRFCFETPPSLDRMSYHGLAVLFDAIGAKALARVAALDILRTQLEGRVCMAALESLIDALKAEAGIWMALPYCVAWLQVAGSNSVLPPWVRHRFPQVAEMLRQLRDTPCGDEGCSYCKDTHDPATQLRRYFGFSAFRKNSEATSAGYSLQESIVRHAMGDRPLLAILPTGGGKSLCYQLPALVRHFRRGSLTIVISPLQALMKDQVDNLVTRTGIASAAALYGLLTPPERGEVLERVRLGDIAILYVAPEQLRNASFRKVLTQREIGCWVFDEAHCLSKWGHDFRPDYLYAGRFIREFSAEQHTAVPPIACFTATAKQDVKKEILDYFKSELGQELALFESGIERENLSFEVQLVNRAEKFGRIHSILSERLPGSSGSAVVYVSSRKGSEEAAQYLLAQGWHSAAYHAGLSVPEKRSIQDAFIAGDIRVICATNAFGMGIDKEDIRIVIHADIPGSLENYLQEAGRAGRDLHDAQCILLYDEQDVETQFKLQAFSQLSRQDITQILRGLRRARRNRSGEVVITTGELLRDEDVETAFGTEDPQADTKVRSAVAWLERAGFLERNQNDTRVFQGKPLVRSLDEARARMVELKLSSAQQEKWLAILQALMNADVDEGLSADQLAELPQLKKDVAKENNAPFNPDESPSLQVLRILHSMAEAGLVKKGLMLSAFVRHKVKNHSDLIFERVCFLEDAMLKLMRESAPDAASEGWLDLSVRKLNQRLLDEGHEDSNPQLLLNLLKSLSLDGRGLAGRRGSLDLRPTGQEHYRVKLHRDWEALLETARRRRMVARVALETILSKVPHDAPVSADVLVSFSSDEIAQALRSNVYLSGQIKDPLAAIDRALMFLHEQKVIILQQGLAVFRQAMTIRVSAKAKSRRYAGADYEPLSRHYRERILQIHVMNEYARLGLDKIRQALELVLAYFSLDKTTFLKRFFPGRKELIERATGEESYRYIVEELGNRVQMEVVTATEEINMLVLAGPGSGKTRVVVHRCAYLLRVKRVPAKSILVLCYNRNAAVSLRKRLFELAGADARGVMVQTYHGLAMRLTGTSFAELAEKAGGESPRFDSLIPEAIRLLRGEKEILGVEPDELRDRLLSGYRHILVDEYQDIDEDQYALISAIAGRTEQDRDRKLSILAVGDDDQNIYTFRGANVKFIRQFCNDYTARRHYLVENYRSTAHIISAANSLIRQNRDRMKTERAICINRSREAEPAGSAWDSRDPVARGRVQLLEVKDEHEQAMALVSELKRLQKLDSSLGWSGFAVLARTRGTLSPIRALLEYHGIPVVWSLSKDKTPPLHHVREIGCFLDELKLRRKELMRASEMHGLLSELAGGCEQNPWWQLLRDLLDSWAEETADTKLPVSQTIEAIFEFLAEQRREQFMGRGVFLGTVHGAKGMEFPHVFIPDGGWSKGSHSKESEEERRLFYVAMTRARETLCTFERKDRKNPHLALLDGASLLRRPGHIDSSLIGEMMQTMHKRYELLGMKDMFLSFAAYRPPGSAIHLHLAALQPGSLLEARKNGKKIELINEQGYPVAALSQSAAAIWSQRLDKINCIRVVAMVRRQEKGSDDQFRGKYRSGSWEVPWVEIISSA